MRQLQLHHLLQNPNPPSIQLQSHHHTDSLTLLSAAMRNTAIRYVYKVFDLVFACRLAQQ